MKENFTANSLKKQISGGLTGACTIGAYCIAVCALFGQGTLVCLGLIILCAFLSVKSDGVFSPSPLFAVVLFVSFSAGASLSGSLGITAGCLLFIIINKFIKNKTPPDFILGGCTIGLALCATILITNTYFGIGAYGTTPIEMLKVYRSVGFHPDFRGLLYGTITLFTMITYPFKFKNLNKRLPAEFITVAIPFALNVLLNPSSEYTTTNEYTSVLTAPRKLSLPQLSDTPQVLALCIATAIILFILSQNNRARTGVSAASASSISGIPVIKYPVPCFTVVSAITAAALWSAVLLIFPNVVSRLPLPCVGSMLIVSAWQHISFKDISAVMKSRRPVRFLAFVLCALIFVIAPLHIASIICFAVWGINTLTEDAV